jgi:hypothetical protein
MGKHITRTISNDSYWQINKHLHRLLGLRTTLLLQHFIDLQTKVFGGKEFYQSYSQIEDELCFTEHTIKQSIKKLNEKNVISVTKKGMPAKNYYLVDLTRVEELLSLDREKSPNKSEVSLTGENHPTSELKITSLDREKSTDLSSDNHLTKKRNNKKELKKEINNKSLYKAKNESLNKEMNKVLASDFDKWIEEYK